MEIVFFANHSCLIFFPYPVLLLSPKEWNGMESIAFVRKLVRQVSRFVANQHQLGALPPKMEKKMTGGNKRTNLPTTREQR